ncbi:plant lipid transfer protein/Par allergen [Artemisia annua]|uniref:Non-specific lipid-transfer protein n=1 Tax=Artemisia annua TaxID=35608 RepID=A0A2U1KWD1_ARTAN|nr:plant lipid transfer protein/Par allergen [Artemisia annua]
MAGVLMKMACVVVACMVVFAPNANAVITCGQVTAGLLPCLGYLRNGGPVPAACCNGVKGLNNAAKSPVDRKSACNCLKNSYNAIGGINGGNAGTLPGKCGVNIPYKISPSTDCSKIR